MLKIENQRIFGLDLDYGLGEDSANFYGDGTMLPADRERILAEYTYPETGIDYGHVSYLEKLARKQIAAILKAEAEYRPPTEEELKAAWIAKERKENEKYYGMMQDLRAWDNDSDDPCRPSIHWRTLDMYDD
jgi:hypothetical protein